MAELIARMESTSLDNDSIARKMVELANALGSVKGKKQYGYLPKKLKELVDAITDELALQPDVAACYQVWNDLRDKLEGYYKDKPRVHNPLSKQKEFKAIKNSINEDYFLHQAEKTFQGNIPQGNNEIMLPANYIEFSGKSYQVGDQVTLDLTGTGQEKEYTLSAILNEEKESNGYYIYVSKELAKTISNNTLQVDAYTRLQTDAITSSAILDFAEKVAMTSGIEKGQINLTEYFAVMTGAIKSGISIPVPILALITTFLAATIVYGVFYTKITKNIQMFGQLRTIGMTKRQIKRMARKEGRIYALEGIPVGLLAGLIIGYVGCPDGFHIKTALIYAVLIAVMAYIAVNIALFKPVRVAMNTSPVEGAKYLIYAGKTKISHKLHRKLNLLNLAKINIHRNRKKAILTLMMLGLR